MLATLLLSRFGGTVSAVKEGAVAIPRGSSKGVYVVVTEITDEAVYFNRVLPDQEEVSSERVRPATFRARYEVIREGEREPNG